MASEKVRRSGSGSGSGSHALFDDMSWPCPGQRLNEIEHALRYGEPTKSELMVAASVLSAYSDLVRCPQVKRAYVVRRLREAIVEEQVGGAIPSEHE